MTQAWQFFRSKSESALDVELPTRSLPPTASMRGAIDSLVQSSLVQLFAAYGVAVAPLPRVPSQRAPSVPEVSAAVGFTRSGRPGQTGKVTLSMPSAVLELMRNGSPALKGDWARELANQLAGRIKNRLLQFSVRLEVGVSATVDSKSLAPTPLFAPGARIYAARTLRGEILVTLLGMPADSELVYASPANVAFEGEAILF